MLGFIWLFTLVYLSSVFLFWINFLYSKLFWTPWEALKVRKSHPIHKVILLADCQMRLHSLPGAKEQGLCFVSYTREEFRVTADMLLGHLWTDAESSNQNALAFERTKRALHESNCFPQTISVIDIMRHISICLYFVEEHFLTSIHPLSRTKQNVTIIYYFTPTI